MKHKAIKNIIFQVILVMLVLFVCGCNVNNTIDKAKIEEDVRKAYEEFDKKEFKIERNSPAGSDISKLTILSVNDFHGALTEDDGEKGIARIGDFIVSEYNKNPDGTIIISAGDMFQGTGISNYRHGRDVITSMNAIGFDLMALGNHEFDWGLEEVLKYRDGDLLNGEANFEFLACNLAQKSKNNQLPENVKEYVILNKGQLKVGVIGYIGYGIESDIATNRVEDYTFLYPVPIVEKLAKKLRTEDNCDVIIVVAHEDSQTINSAVANLTGDSKVDAIVNGHNHLNKYDTINTADLRQVPYVQAGSSGSYVGEISFNVNGKNITFSNVNTHSMSRYASKNNVLDNFVTELVSITSPLFKRKLVVAGARIDKYGCADWAVDALQKYTNADIAFINLGGIRANAFPINANQEVDVAKVYEIAPFDNTVKTVKLKGSTVKTIMQISGLVYSSNASSTKATINGKAIDDNKLYLVSAIDYIFDKTDYPFITGEDIVATGVLFRDVLIEALEKIDAKGNKWTV